MQTQELQSMHQERERVYTREQIRIDEVTAASERFGPMSNTFEYSYDSKGELYFQGEQLRGHFENGIRAAEEVTARHPQFSVELLRRHIELQQYEQQRLFGMSELADDHVLVHVSPPPDAVMNGSVDLNAYDIDRGKILVRLTAKTSGGVRVTSFSLDGNDRVALGALMETYGLDLDTSMGSEDILATHGYIHLESIGEQSPEVFLRARYDQAMNMQYGGEWFAGRRNERASFSLQHIEAYPGHVEEHVDAVETLRREHGKRFRDTEAYQHQLDNFVALMLTLRENPTYDGSAASAGDVARATGVDLGQSDCATGVNASQALEQQGIGNTWKSGECRVCLKEGLVGACSVCSSCEDADNRGMSLDAIHSRALARQAVKQAVLARTDQTYEATKSETSRLSKQALVERRYGQYATLKNRIVIGGAVEEVIDRRTGELLAA